MCYSLFELEEASDSVVAEVHQPERDSLDPFREVVDGFGGPVGDVGAMPRTDLIRPLRDRPPETADLERHLEIAEVATDLGDPLDGELLVGVFVDLTNHLLSRSTRTTPLGAGHQRAADP